MPEFARPPKHVTVGPHRYRIRSHDQSLPDAGCDGICSKDRLTIAVYADQAPSKTADTLLHELTHAMLATVKLDEDTEEAICLALAPALLALMRDNPMLMGWLTD